MFDSLFTLGRKTKPPTSPSITIPSPYSPHVPFNIYLYFQFPPSTMPQDISLSPPFLHYILN